MAEPKTRARQRPVRPEIRKTKFVRHAVIAAPVPAPAVAPRPCGVLGSALVDEIRTAAVAIWPHPLGRRGSRDRGLRDLLQYLSGFPGSSWQERWESSGLDGRGRPVRGLAATPTKGTELTQALEALISMRIIQPTLEAFRANQFRDYPERFRIAQADPQLDAFFDAVAATDTSPHFRRRALFDVCTAITTQGIAFADLTPEAFLHYACHTRDAGLAWKSHSFDGNQPATSGLIARSAYSKRVSNQELPGRTRLAEKRSQVRGLPLRSEWHLAARSGALPHLCHDTRFDLGHQGPRSSRRGGVGRLIRDRVVAVAQQIVCIVSVHVHT